MEPVPEASSMTIIDLIELLSQYDTDILVMLQGQDSGFKCSGLRTEMLLNSRHPNCEELEQTH